MKLHIHSGKNKHWLILNLKSCSYLINSSSFVGLEIFDIMRSPTHLVSLFFLSTAFTICRLSHKYETCREKLPELSVINHHLPLPPQLGCDAHLALKIIQSHSEGLYKVAERAFIRKWNLCTYFFFTSCRTFFLHQQHIYT